MEVSELLRKVTSGNETVLDVDGHGGMEVRSRVLQPEVPEYMPEPPIARADARNHVFHDVGAFCEYLQVEGSKDGTLVLADAKARTVTAILDENDESDREIVTLHAIEHPLFTPWGNLLDRPVPVLEFAMHAMKHRRAVIEPDGKELALTFSQLKMSKSITIATGVGKRSLNGVMVEMNIGGEVRGQAVELPEAITIACPLFIGTAPQNIAIDLLVTDQNDKIVVVAVAPDVEAQRIDAFENFVATIREQTGYLVGLGEARHRGWKVNGKVWTADNEAAGTTVHV